MSRKTIAWTCLAWIVLDQVGSNIPFLAHFVNAVETAWAQLVTQILPFVEGRPYGYGLPLSSLATLLLTIVLVLSTFSEGKAGYAGLRLKDSHLSNEAQVLNLRTKAEDGTNVNMGNYLQEICYIEQGSNTVFLIVLVTVLCLAPGVYLWLSAKQVLYLIPFAVIAVVALIVLLGAYVVIATADGSVQRIRTSKFLAKKVLETVSQPDPNAFFLVSFGGVLTIKEVHLRKDRVTGVVEIWRFPWIWLFLFLLTAAGAAYSISQKQSALVVLVPLVLLVVVIVLALRRRTMVKMIGGHYYALGTGSSLEELLKAITSGKKPSATLPPRYMG